MTAGADLAGRDSLIGSLPGDDLEESSDGERLAAYLRSLPFRRAVLFPCSAHWSLAVGSSAGRCFILTVVIAAVLVDKKLFAAAVEEYGVPAPRVLDATDLDTIEPNALPTFFLKPTSSQPYRGDRRQGIG